MDRCENWERNLLLFLLLVVMVMVVVMVFLKALKLDKREP